MWKAERITDRGFDAHISRLWAAQATDKARIYNFENLLGILASYAACHRYSPIGFGKPPAKTAHVGSVGQRGGRTEAHIQPAKRSAKTVARNAPWL